MSALIIPALNEAEVIGPTMATIPPGLFSMVIVADNGSTDGTGDVAREAGATVVHGPHRGYGSACMTAPRAVPACTSAVVFMQADGSEDPAEATRLLAPIYDGRADLVIGSRTPGRRIRHIDSAIGGGQPRCHAPDVLDLQAHLYRSWSRHPHGCAAPSRHG